MFSFFNHAIFRALATVTVPSALAFELSSSQAGQLSSIIVQDQDHAALGGYDPMGYILLRKPVKGSPFFPLKHGDVTWHFASVLNRSTFLVDIEKFSPQFGRRCAFSLSRGVWVAADPIAWKVQGGKLYMFRNHEALIEWSKDIEGNLSKAEANWPEIVEK